MEIILDDLTNKAVLALLEDHLNNMALHSPPESRHVLDVSKLKSADISFWSMWDHGQLMGCGALKALNSGECEIKSMKTANQYLRKGVAAKMLAHILAFAKLHNYKTIYLETGSMAAFEPAKQLYLKNGFELCAPFAQYKEDPNSLFMQKQLD